MKKDPKRTHEGSPIAPSERKRLVFVFIVLFSFFALLTIQFYRIQILEGDKWRKIAASQHYTVVEEPARRGLFYSNTSLKVAQISTASPLVIDVPKFHLFVDPQVIPEVYRQNIADQLKNLLHLSENDAIKLRKQLDKKSRSRKLVMWIDRSTYEEILQWWGGFARKKKIAQNALFFIQDWQRSYPYGKLLGQVLHTVRDDRNPKTNRFIPTGGLETTFDQVLSGKDGKRQIMRSPRHPLDTGQLITPPEHGADIYLTIDHTLQAIAEEEICKAVEKAGAKGGWAIMMDPYTGEILVLAQYPFFKPASYRQFFNNPKCLDDTKVKGLTDPYEPGSTFKPITLSCGLLANAELVKRGRAPLFSPQEKMATVPRVFPGRNKVLKDVRTHRFLNMYMGLQKSSNVYMATIVHRIIEQLGADWYRSCLQDIFGFGVKTGIELPGESVGLLPKPGKTHPNGALEWSAPTPYSLAMGHNVLTNSFQMLRAYGIIANGGYEVFPTLVRKIVKTTLDGEQIVLRDNTLKETFVNRKRLLPTEVVEEVTKAMKFATKPGGCAARADIYGYSEAGKSGTSEKVIAGQYSKKNHISTFIGFAPTSHPRFVLLIAIDEPEYRYIPGVGKNQLGGTCAAPVFREIGSRTLQYLGIEPDDPCGYPAGDPRYQPEKGDWQQEIKQLSDLYKQWNG
ncbi:MAG: penicillin-binding protein 2 [Simkania sp.]|nr:penicillin-binding protein 2 [Simkania sp.]